MPLNFVFIEHLEKIDDPEAVAASIGQRQAADIRIERYLSQGMGMGGDSGCGAIVGVVFIYN